jgi:Holliday junction resolvase RusA-like endonuclease
MGRRVAATAPTNATPVDLEPTGTVIAEGTVPGRAVSWKAPAVTRAGKVISWDTGSNANLNRKVRSYKSFVCWVQLVQLHLKTISRRRRPYGGPVELWATFYLRPMSNDRQSPDLCNAVKAFEDAMQGIVIINDSQVMRHRTDRVMSAQQAERVEFRVIAL